MPACKVWGSNCPICLWDCFSHHFIGMAGPLGGHPPWNSERKLPCRFILFKCVYCNLFIQGKKKKKKKMHSFSKALECVANFFVCALFKVQVPLHETPLDINFFCPGSFCSYNLPAIFSPREYIEFANNISSPKRQDGASLVAAVLWSVCKGFAMLQAVFGILPPRVDQRLFPGMR